MNQISGGLKKYFGQWQRFPKPVGEWQRGEEHVWNEGRLEALQYIVDSSKSVLDCGCGIGLDYQPLSQLKYFGVDITPKFIVEAQRLGVPCQEANVLCLPFRNKSYETVYCRNLLLHLPPDQVFNALDEMLRVAAKQVVTMEPAWLSEADYKIRELIDCNTEDQLMFFSNNYGEQEMKMYIAGKKLKVHWWRGHDTARSNFLHKPMQWQVTVYTK